MPQKLKIILGALVLVAGFLIIRVGSSFYRSAKTAALISQIIITPTPEENPLTKDTDGDGLSDRDEIIYATDMFNKDTDGDGYIDGEEIASGYDPLDPFDNPKTRTSGNNQIAFVSPSANMTDRLLNLGLANLLDDSGTLNPDQMTTEKFADVIGSINNDAALYLKALPLRDEDLKITQDNGKDAIKKYINTVTTMMEEGMFAPAGGIIGSSAEDILGMSDNQNYYENKYNSLKIVEVPSSWKEVHKSALANLATLANSTKALTAKSIDEDPVKASLALNQVQDSFLALNGLLSQAALLAQSQGISTQDSILDMLKITTKPITP